MEYPSSCPPHVCHLSSATSNNSISPFFVWPRTFILIVCVSSARCCALLLPAFSTSAEQDITKVPKEFLVIGFAFVAFFTVFSGIGAGSLCNIVGFVYPAFKSFEAIESQNRGDDTQWLIYWVVYAFFSVIEVCVDFLLYWIPFYYAFKLAFLLWAFLPQTKGASFLYHSFLKDFLKENESRIDAAMDAATRDASSIAKEAVAASAAGLSAAADYAGKSSESETDKKDI